MNKKKNPPRQIIALSGGFDPPTEGHIAMILDAGKLGDVVIILNSDEWCDKARYLGCWMPWQRRCDVLKNIEGVIDVVSVDDTNGDVCEALKSLKPDFFGNGGGRTLSNTPEVELCKKMGIGMLWLLGNDEKYEARDMLYQATAMARKKMQSDNGEDDNVIS
jgi:cytidyltransferase-like protein